MSEWRCASLPLTPVLVTPSCRDVAPGARLNAPPDNHCPPTLLAGGVVVAAHTDTSGHRKTPDLMGRGLWS